MSTETALATQAPSAELVLPEPVARRGITEYQWRTLANNLFPGANPRSVLMVWDYCAARGLDPMKKPCHIVPMEVKDANGDYAWRDVVMPGIYEYRITAHRTGDYLGHEKPIYGPDIEAFGVKAPDWCEFTAYRWNHKAREKVPYTVQVFFSEVVATRKDKKTGEFVANSRWSRAPRQMLAKCAEAAALREAFPEEIGGEPTAEEMDGQRAINVTPLDRTPPTAWDKVPEALRDNVEKAFAALDLPPGLRLAKLNEWLGAEGVDPEEATANLLAWCAQELTAKATRPKRSGGNGKSTVSKPAPASDAGAANAGVESAGADQSAPAAAQPAADADRAPAVASAPVAKKTLDLF